MDRKKLRVAFFRSYPLVSGYCNKHPTLKVTPLCELPGLAVEILKLITDHLNMTIEVAVAKQRLGPEEWQELVNGSIDVFSSTDEKTDKRLENFDFSDTLYEVSSLLAVKRTDSPISNVFDFFKVFTVQVWLMMGLALLIFALIGVFIQFMEYKLRLRPRVKVIGFIWRALRLQLNQYETEKVARLNMRAEKALLFVFAFIQCSIVISLFQSSILTSIVQLKPVEPFQVENLADLLKSKKYSFVTNNMKSWYFEEMNTSYYSPYYELRHATANNPIIELPTEEDVLNAVGDGDKIVVMQEDERSYFVATQHFCEYVYMKSPFPVSNKRFMMRKKHPLLPIINKAIAEQKMMIQRVYRKYTTYRTQTLCNWRSNDRPPLSFRPFFGVLILFGIGVTSASFVFVIEKLIGKRLLTRYYY